MWSPAAQMYDLEKIKAYFTGHGYRNQIDNTRYKRGSLWIITDRDHAHDQVFFESVNDKFDTNFIFAPHGASATGNDSAWFWVPGHYPGFWLGPGLLED